MKAYMSYLENMLKDGCNLENKKEDYCSSANMLEVYYNLERVDYLNQDSLVVVQQVLMQYLS